MRSTHVLKAEYTLLGGWKVGRKGRRKGGMDEGRKGGSAVCVRPVQSLPFQTHREAPLSLVITQATRPHDFILA